MNRSWALSPWLQVPFGLAFLLLGLASPWLFAEDEQQGDALRAGRDCPTGTVVGERSDCLVVEPARVTEQRSRRGSARYHLVPDDRSVRGDWVRFDDDRRSEGPVVVAISGDPVGAVYAGDDVVAVDADGDRSPTRTGEPGHARDVAWGGLWIGTLGALMLTGAWSRHRADRPLRRGWDELAPGTPQPEAPPTATAWVSLVLLSVMLGGFGAFFAGSLQAELITFTAVAGPFAALMWWSRRRALRRTSPGSATAT